eukprot:7518134-Pyramimonas_sp.AAC.1
MTGRTVGRASSAGRAGVELEPPGPNAVSANRSGRAEVLGTAELVGLAGLARSLLVKPACLGRRFVALRP